MNQVFVSEYFCGGAWPGADLPQSVFREGQLMLEAVCQDLLSQTNCQVTTTCDRRIALSSIPRLQVIPVASPQAEWEAFQWLARQADTVLVIAPEWNHILLERIEWLEQEQIPHCQSSSTLVELTSDKWKFSQWCQAHQIPQPETVLLESPLPVQLPLPYPVIVKPRFGAGSVSTAILWSDQEWQTFRTETSSQEFAPYLVQPYLAGLPVSISCLVHPHTHELLWTPPGQQLFEGLTYRGGIVPAFSEVGDAIQNCAAQVIQNIAGWKGYVGIDLLYHPGESDFLIVLEVNPRLTTSYLGYRAIAEFPLAEWMIGIEGDAPPEWSPFAVRFDLHGNVNPH